MKRILGCLLGLLIATGVAAQPYWNTAGLGIASTATGPCSTANAVLYNAATPCSANLTFDGTDLTLGASSKITFSGRSKVSSGADGNILLTNNAGTAFGMLQFGGTSSSFPALRRESGTQIDVITADGGSYATLRVGTIGTTGGTISFSATAGAGPTIAAGTAASAVSAETITQTRNFNTSATNYISKTYTITSAHASDVVEVWIGGSGANKKLMRLTAAGALLIGDSATDIPAANGSTPASPTYGGVYIGDNSAGVNSIFSMGTNGTEILRLGVTSSSADYRTIGTQYHSFMTDVSVEQVRITRTASANRYITLTGSNGGNPTIDVSAGSLAITPAVVAASTVKATAGLIVTALADSGTAPTIASGGCTSPAMVGTANGTARFELDVGTSCSGSQPVVLTLPAATTGWLCVARNITNGATSAPAQTGAVSTTAATLTNFARTTGLAAAWTDGDNIEVACRGG